MPDLDLADIQGIIVRSYGMTAVRFAILRINRAAAARRTLRRLLDGGAGSGPRITVATQWTTKPAYTVNIGFTSSGLEAIGLPTSSLYTFPAAFNQGPAYRAPLLGDTGGNAPSHWVGGMGSESSHVVLFVGAMDDAARDTAVAEIQALFDETGAFTELSHRDGDALPGGVEHFGYKMGLSQVNIEGAPGRPSPWPAAPTGQFLLGYPSQFPDYTYPVPTPPELGRNGSFAAYRIVRQDVETYLRFLSEWAGKVGMTEEKLAAKVCGRWRNGVPLVLSPDTDSPGDLEEPGDLDRFNYVPGDEEGYRCPIGAHIRRVNPRGEKVPHGSSRLRLLVRRGIPYGKPYDPANPNDGIERGFAGLLICVSLRDQFEFVLSQWVNSGLFEDALRGTRDLIIGTITPQTSRFVIQAKDGDRTITGFTRFCRTMGTEYCFLPSITGLRYLADLR